MLFDDQDSLVLRFGGEVVGFVAFSRGCLRWINLPVTSRHRSVADRSGAEQCRLDDSEGLAAVIVLISLRRYHVGLK